MSKTPYCYIIILSEEIWGLKLNTRYMGFFPNLINIFA